eukprot:m.169866 g.169866  ORF g.169866 m.169866 type:complete len:613 (+) comp16673_c0_seq3:138-1976(+)
MSDSAQPSSKPTKLLLKGGETRTLGAWSTEKTFSSVVQATEPSKNDHHREQDGAMTAHAPAANGRKPQLSASRVKSKQPATTKHTRAKTKSAAPPSAPQPTNSLDFGALLKAASRKGTKKKAKSTNKAPATSTAASKVNPLDSSAPTRRRGKERVTPKPRKPTKIKQLLEAEKAERRSQTAPHPSASVVDVLGQAPPTQGGDADASPTALTPLPDTSAETERQGADTDDNDDKSSTAPSVFSNPSMTDPETRDDNLDRDGNDDSTSVSSTRSSRSASFNPDAASFVPHPEAGAVAPTSPFDAQFGDLTYPDYTNELALSATQDGASVGNFQPVLMNEYLTVPPDMTVVQAGLPILPIYHSPSPEFGSRHNSFSSTASHRSSRSSSFSGVGSRSGSFSGVFPRSRHSSFNGTLPPRPSTASKQPSTAQASSSMNQSDFFPVTCPELHSLKFREYCKHMLSPELDDMVRFVLSESVRFHRRALQSNETKAKIRKRYVTGLNEVRRATRLNKVQTMIVAPDVQRTNTKGGLDDTLKALIDMAAEANTPCVFALSRSQLARIMFQRRNVTVVALLRVDSLEPQLRAIHSLVGQLTDDYRRREQEVLAARVVESSES